MSIEMSAAGTREVTRPPCIAFITLEIYPATAGGVGILLTKTITLLLQLGYEIVLVLDVQRHEYETFINQHKLTFENGHNLHVYLVEDLAEGAELPEHGFAHTEVRRAARIHFAMETLKARHVIDLIEYYDYCGPAYYALTATSEREPAIAVRLHNSVELIARKIRSPLDPERLVQFATERTCLAGADGLLTPGQKFFEEEIRPLYESEASPDRTHYSAPVHTPVGEITYDTNARNVVFYGRLSTFKGLDTFIRGAVLALQSQSFSSWLNTFLIIGPEETVASAFSLDDMKRMIPDHLMDRFEFTGRVRHDELMQHLATAAFACFANRMESFCYAAHEIHTAGVPLVLSDTPAFRDHFEEDQAAVFFDATSPGLARSMVRMGADPDLRRRLSEAGKSRAPEYLTDHYAAHLRDLPVKTFPADAHASMTVFVLTDKPRAGVLETVRNLRGVTLIVLTLDDDGPVRFSGMRWRATDASNQEALLELHEATEAAVFVRAGDIIDEAWLKAARRLMAVRPDVGSVGGFTRRNGTLHANPYSALPEMALARGCGLRTAIRLRPGSTFQEALCSWSTESEVSLMLAERDAGRLCLELPQVSVDTSRAIEMRAPNLEDVIDVDFDRLSPDFLAVFSKQAFRLSGDTHAFQALSPHEKMLLSDTATQDGLVHIRANPTGTYGEVMMLRLFRGPGEVASTWSAVEASGEWTLVNDRNGPVQGALKTHSGEVRTYINEAGRIDFLRAPFAGEIDVYFRGQLRTVSLKSDQIYDISLRFTDTVEVVAKDIATTQSGGAALHPRHASLGQSDLQTAFIVKDLSDLDPFAPSQEMRLRTYTADEFALDTVSRDGSNLTKFAQTVGASALVFSSAIEPTTALANALSAVPPSIRFGLILSGSYIDNEENPAAARFNSVGGWFNLISTIPERFSVVSRSKGMLDLFSSKGIQTVWMPSRLTQLPVGLGDPGADTGGLNLAIIESDSVAKNILHMVNAAIMAAAIGIKIDSIWLPESRRYDIRHIDEINLELPLRWYSSLAELEHASIGEMRVAMACYPDEEWPTGLTQAARSGWLPLAGSTSELEGLADLEDRLAVPFWEDSRDIKDRLIDISSSYSALRTAYNEASADRETYRTQSMHALWAREGA
ncbi:MAG: glycosyltransferase family 4 protein [Pseudomonadota bacterium]